MVSKGRRAVVTAVAAAAAAASLSETLIYLLYCTLATPASLKRAPTPFPPLSPSSSADARPAPLIRTALLHFGVWAGMGPI